MRSRQGSGSGHRAAVSVVFAGLGLLSGTFATRVPAIKADLGLSSGRLGLALLGPALGCILSAPVTGLALRRLSPRTWIVAGLVPFCAMLPIATLAGGLWLLAAALGLWGFAAGMVDVAMNTEAARVQDLVGRPVMSTFHATYSVGALAGAGAGALAAAAGLAVGPDFSLVGAVVVVVGLLAARGLPAGAVARSGAGPVTEAAEAHGAGPAPGGAGPARGDPGRRREAAGTGKPPTWALVALAVACFSCFLCEGAANDWSAVYLHSSLGAAPGPAALAYTAFACTMVAGRLAGDRLTSRFGPVRLVRVAAAIGAAGLGAGLAIGGIGAGIAGFALLGVGLAVGVPLAVTAASRLASTGPAVAAVVAAGYVGLVSGPPVIGGLAELVGLRAALGLVVALCALLVPLAGSLGAGRGSAAGDRSGADPPGGRLSAPAARARA